MRRLMPFCVLCLVAGLAPLVTEKLNFVQQVQAFPGWPSNFDGKTLRQLPLTDRENLFLQYFPGSIGRFTDGRREYIFRWLTSATRKFHPASDCFRGIGYQIEPLSNETLRDNSQWNVFRASKGSELLRVYERIYDRQGNSWTDASSWYWAALLGESEGPWWAVTIAEVDPDRTKPG